MIKHLLEEYKMTLDDLIAAGTDSPHLHELMDQAELYLEWIHIELGPEVYETMNKNYINTLEIIGVIGYMDNTKK